MGGHNDQAYEPKDTHSSLCVLAVCLVSGGMDSCVTAAIGRQENEELADHFGVTKRLAVSIEHLKQIGGSSLTDPNIAVTKANLASPKIPTSYVPFRNSHLLSIATSWGEVIGAQRIYIGAVAEDSS